MTLDNQHLFERFQTLALVAGCPKCSLSLDAKVRVYFVLP